MTELLTEPGTSPPAGPVLVLVGPPGALAAQVGAALAARLGVACRDTDADVEAVAGRPVEEVFLYDGEAGFRTLERAAVRAALIEHHGVLVLGGGAVLDEATRSDLHGHRVVFLDVGVADAAKRIGFNRDRPTALGNPRASWLRLMAARRPLYEQVADVRVSTDGRTADEVADDLAGRVADDLSARDSTARALP